MKKCSFLFVLSIASMSLTSCALAPQQPQNIIHSPTEEELSGNQTNTQNDETEGTNVIDIDNHEEEHIDDDQGGNDNKEEHHEEEDNNDQEDEDHEEEHNDDEEDDGDDSQEEDHQDEDDNDDDNITVTTYYASINSSLSGDNLKVALYNIIKGHDKYDYDNLEIAMRTTDRDWSKSPDPKDENPKMHLLYLVDNENKPKDWNLSHGGFGSTVDGVYVWDKEHIWAKANGFSKKGLDAYSDLHHLRASDQRNNNNRSNLAFNNVPNGSYVLDCNGDKSGKKGGSCYEPIDCDKGDVARALFYMATRYYSGDGSGGTHLTLTNGTDSSGGKWGYVSTLLQWNEQDPPDEFEKHRNDLIYEQFQHNRNPFVDHPEYAARIWGK